jgi:hypothetical protein
MKNKSLPLTVLLVYTIFLFISGCASSPALIITTPLTSKLSKYRSISLIYDISHIVSPQNSAGHYKRMNTVLIPDIQQLGYDPIYQANEAKKADLWVRICLIEINDLPGKVGFSVKFIDVKTKTKLGEIKVYGSDDKNVKFKFGGDIYGYGGIAVNDSGLEGYKDSMHYIAVDNASKEIIKYLKNNE